MGLIKRSTAILLSALLLSLSGCAPAQPANPTATGAAEEPGSVQSEQELREEFAHSTPENDTDLGLRNVKIDTAEQELTEAQKYVLQYFDEDYLDVPSYEFLRRYPNVFQDAQLALWGTVAKVLALDSEHYELVLWFNVSPQDIGWGTAGELHSGEYVIIRGQVGDSSFMEGDPLLICGRYTGIETLEIDGISYTIPTVDAHRAFYQNAARSNLRLAEKFDYSFIKVVAEAIFGKDIELRDPVAGEDLSVEEAMVDYYALGYMPYPDMDPSEIDAYRELLVELEDQSNANFQKFRFSKFEGRITDAKGPFDSGIERQIEFSADFEHFFLLTHNTGLESLTLAYYDKEFNKLWEREFEETTSAVYDYTKNNLYIVVNNQLYIINIATGEDTFPPTYVGEKKEIRKLRDGILMVSGNKSDGMMKSELDGSILWTANLPTDVQDAAGLQLVNENIILQYTDETGMEHYTLVNEQTGELTIHAEAL